MTEATAAAVGSPQGPRHFLDIADLDAATLRAMIDEAAAMKAARTGLPRGTADTGAVLAGRLLVMIFEQSSTRTRVSFEVAVRQLGGSTIVLQGDQMQLGRGESVADTARVLSRYGDIIAIRARHHDALAELAENADVPVINALTDRSHPCQLMADVMTFEEQRGPIAGAKIAWSGDGNNVAASLIHAAVRFDFSLALACPEGLEPRPELIDWARAEGGDVTVTADPAEAVAGAGAVYTDTWTSMNTSRSDNRDRALEAYQVTPELMAAAGPGAIFLHCLPAHRGEEVAAEVIDGPRSVVWDQAENRLHAQKAILRWCLDR